MAHLEGAYEQVSDRLNGVDRRLECIEHKIGASPDRLDRKIDSRSGQFLGLIMTSWVTTILAVLLHH